MNLSPTPSQINGSKEVLDTVESAKTQTQSKSTRQVLDDAYGDYLAVEHVLTKNMSTKLSEVMSVDEKVPRTGVVRLKKH